MPGSPDAPPAPGNFDRSVGGTSPLGGNFSSSGRREYCVGSPSSGSGFFVSACGNSGGGTAWVATFGGSAGFLVSVALVASVLVFFVSVALPVSVAGAFGLSLLPHDSRHFSSRDGSACTTFVSAGFGVGVGVVVVTGGKDDPDEAGATLTIVGPLTPDELGLPQFPEPMFVTTVPGLQVSQPLPPGAPQLPGGAAVMTGTPGRWRRRVPRTSSRRHRSRRGGVVAPPVEDLGPQCLRPALHGRLAGDGAPSVTIVMTSPVSRASTCKTLRPLSSTDTLTTRHFWGGLPASLTVMMRPVGSSGAWEEEGTADWPQTRPVDTTVARTALIHRDRTMRLVSI